MNIIIVAGNKRTLVRGGKHYYLRYVSKKDGSQLWCCTFSNTCHAKFRIRQSTILLEDRHTCTKQGETVTDFKQEIREQAIKSHLPVYIL